MEVHEIPYTPKPKPQTPIPKPQNPKTPKTLNPERQVREVAWQCPATSRGAARRDMAGLRAWGEGLRVKGFGLGLRFGG